MIYFDHCPAFLYFSKHAKSQLHKNRKMKGHSETIVLCLNNTEKWKSVIHFSQNMCQNSILGLINSQFKISFIYRIFSLIITGK